MKKTFVINGPGRSGKDTFIKMCRLFLRNAGIKVYSFSSILPVKKELINWGVWDGLSEKTSETRKKMAQLKKEMTQNGDIPNQYLISQIKALPEDTITFVHIREAENIQAFLSKHTLELGNDAQAIHYMRDDGTMEEFHSGVDLLSETREFKNYDFDIVNSVHGLEEMKSLVRNFINQALPNQPLEDFSISMLWQESMHKEFNDHEKAGII